ncbi:hypothetical protein [Cohnella sp.]|uniref:hypothetical protein n=1 Tax=Cohnella sp. TaxID=1883426 RepID=UPI0037037EF7
MSIVLNSGSADGLSEADGLADSEAGGEDDAAAGGEDDAAGATLFEPQATRSERQSAAAITAILREVKK